MPDQTVPSFESIDDSSNLSMFEDSCSRFYSRVYIVPSARFPSVARAARHLKGLVQRLGGVASVRWWQEEEQRGEFVVEVDTDCPLMVQRLHERISAE